MIHEDLIPLLEAGDIGVWGTDLAWGDMPDEPHDLAVFYESPGPAGTYTKSAAVGTEGRLQCLSRAESYPDAMSKALEVYALLDDLDRLINGTHYRIRALQRPFDVGARDEQGRTIISTNYEIHIYGEVSP